MHTITVSPFLRACGSVSTRLRPAALATTAAGFSASPVKASGLATCCCRTSTNLFTSTTRFASSSSSGFVSGLRNSVRLPPCEFYGSRLYNNRSFVVAAGLARQTARRIIVRDFPGFGRQQQPGGVRVLASAASGLLQGGSRMASSHGKRIVPRGRSVFWIGSPLSTKSNLFWFCKWIGDYTPYWICYPSVQIQWADCN